MRIPVCFSLVFFNKTVWKLKQKARRIKMGNNKEKAITKMSMKLREENAPAIVEIKVVDDEFSSYMERKIQDDTYRFSVLADLVKRKKQGEVFSI